MRGKTQNGRTMLKSQNISLTAPTAGKRSSLIECAPSVASMVDVLLSQKRKLNLPLIGIDLLGGDDPSPSYFMAALDALTDHIVAPCSLCFFTQPEQRAAIEPLLHTLSAQKPHLHTYCLDVCEVIGMDEDPLLATRMKKHASTNIAMHNLKMGAFDALISNGNTGALLASATKHLALLPGITRAGLLVLVPTQTDPVAVIDVGAHLQCTAAHLAQFAQLGVAYQKSRGLSAPKIGLLNIGREETKGGQTLRDAYHHLANLYPVQTTAPDAPTFIGNIEANRVFEGGVDVLVTEGFAGNIFLKTAEGISSFIFQQIATAQRETPDLLSKLPLELATSKNHGALLCGVNSIVIKCHGHASPAALLSSTQAALNMVRSQTLTTLEQTLTTSLYRS